MNIYPGLQSKNFFRTQSTIFQRFASKKQGGKSKNGRDSNPKYLGMKMNHGQVFFLLLSIILTFRLHNQEISLLDKEDQIGKLEKE
jgi:hypothetical protein